MNNNAVETTGIKLVSPCLYLVGRQELNDPALIEFLADHDQDAMWMNGDHRTHESGDSELLIESGGRLCYMSFSKPRPGGNKSYIEHILEVGHGSVLEHAVWNFVLTGVSRSLSHELVRHRAGMGYSQLSQRYVDESVAEYIIPTVIDSDPQLKRQWLESIKKSHDTYCLLTGKLYLKVCEKAYANYVKASVGDTPEEPNFTYDEWLSSMPQELRTTLRKEARQAARSVLPNATETKLMVTANARALRNFLELRAHPAAELEIRRVAMMFYDILVSEAPNIFGDYVVQYLDDGSQCLTTPYRKV